MKNDRNTLLLFYLVGENSKKVLGLQSLQPILLQIDNYGSHHSN